MPIMYLKLEVLYRSAIWSSGNFVTYPTGRLLGSVQFSSTDIVLDSRCFPSPKLPTVTIRIHRLSFLYRALIFLALLPLPSSTNLAIFLFSSLSFLNFTCMFDECYRIVVCQMMFTFLISREVSGMRSASKMTFKYQVWLDILLLSIIVKWLFLVALKRDVGG